MNLPTEYDEDHELTRFVWNCCARFMTPFERTVGDAIIAREKMALGRAAAAEEVLPNWGRVGDVDVDAALAHGPEAFRRSVRDRLLTEVGEATLVNRCPQCRRIVRSAKAQQCLWCGHDWH